MAEPKLFANEDAYDAMIAVASAKYQVKPELIKAFIAMESNFNPAASRPEPQLKPVKIPGLEKGGDKSYGLMQVLYRTAWALGYRGKPEGLFDPQTNIDLGTRYISDLVRAAGSKWGVESVISSYNAGGSADRPGDGKRTTSAKDGKVNGQLAPFVNQVYVNKVYRYYLHFVVRGTEARGSPSPKSPSGPAREGAATSSDRTVSEAERVLNYLPPTPPVIYNGPPPIRQEAQSIYRAPVASPIGLRGTIALLLGAVVFYLSFALVRDA